MTLRNVHDGSRLGLLVWLLLVGMLARLPIAGASADLSWTIDLGHHRAPITVFAVDEQRQTLLSSDGKPILRSWDLLSGALRKTIYLPDVVGSGQTVSALALGGNGSELAVVLAGKDADGQAAAALLLIDRKDSEVRWTAQLDTSAKSVYFPRNGSALYLCLADGGIRRYSAATGQEAVQVRHPGRGHPCHIAGRDTQGGLIVYWRDGRLERLSPDLALRHGMVLSDPGLVGSVLASPDGSRIAVSYRGLARWNVLQSEDLAILPTATISNALDQEIGAVAWSADSSTVILLCQELSSSAQKVYRIGSRGMLQLSATALPNLRVTALAGLAQDSMLLFQTAAAATGFVVRAANGQLLLQRMFAMASILPSSIVVEPDGQQIRFALQSSDPKQSPKTLRFSVRDQSLQTITPVRPTDRIETSQSPHKGEASAPESLPLADGQTEATATRADAVWKVEPDDAGSLHWKRAKDGRHALSLFVHPDGKRWIAWTPHGHYGSSIGGDSLLGLRVPRLDSQSQPDDFVPIALLKHHLYEPNKITRSLDVSDTDVAAADSDPPGSLSALRRVLPPVVTVLDFPDGTSTDETVLSFRVAARSLSGSEPVALRAMVQGRQVKTREVVLDRPSKGADPGGRQSSSPYRQIQVSLPPENCTVAVQGETQHSKSAPVLFPVRWMGAHKPEEIVKPTLYVLSIGVSRYKQPALSLLYAAKDARDLAAVLQRQTGTGKRYQKVVTRVLTDEQATRENILAGLSWLSQNAAPNDLAVLFLAGHGINDPASGTYYYLPHEADTANPEGTMLAADRFQKFLSQVQGKAVLFLDTCHSGNVLGGGGAAARSTTRLVSELSSVDNGVVVFAASTSGQVSRESPAWGNGAFTRAAIEALQGKADFTGQGRITVSVLEHYISERVAELTDKQQTPTTAKPITVTDFLFVTVPKRIPLHKSKAFWAITIPSVLTAAGLGIGLGIAYGDPYPKTTGGYRFVSFP